MNIPAGLLSAVLGLGLVFSASTSTNTPSGSAQTKTLQFSVYLDDDPIGYHRFVVEKLGSQKIIESTANFKVKILVFNAYEYQHENREVWRRGCLQKMESRTNDNGELFTVTAEREQEKVSVATLRHASRYQGCVKTFAYWDPDLIRSDRLLNAQTGEYLDVSVEQLGPGTITYQGRQQEAIRYRIKGKDLNIDVWYTPQGEWIALDSLRDGRLISYRRQL